MTFDKSVFIPVDLDAAFALVTEPERLRRWQVVAARVDLRVGGEYRWTVIPGHTASGSFVDVVPGKHVVFTWGWEGQTDLPPGASTVAITLEPAAGGTSVRLVHDGLDEAQSASHAEGWNHYLERLVTLATTGDAGADEWMQEFAELDPIASAEAGLAILQRVLRSITPADLGSQTPCDDFTVAQLADHLRGGVTSISTALGATTSTPVGASLEAQIADLGQETLEALTRRGLEGSVDLGFAELPAQTVAGILNLEFLVHAWDFASATGQSITVPSALSDYVYELAQATISPQQRENGSFASAVPVAETASSLDRLIAFTGRQTVSV